MKKQKMYNIYTDASFDNKSSVATYSIIIMLENKVLKSYSKKSRIEIKNSTEIEVFVVYQAMNLILSCYINKSENQKIEIDKDKNIFISFNFAKLNSINENLDEFVKIEEIIELDKTQQKSS